jgi:dihydropteroate synthase
MPGKSFESLSVRGRSLELGEPLVMGILNVTPDSFSDGGLYARAEIACDRALEMLAEGANIIDVGGESTRPGSEPVSAEREIGRVAPVLEAILKEAPGTILSIDTSKSEVAKVAAEIGAAIINDVSAGTFDPEIGRVAADFDCGFIAMHMLGTPRTMQDNPHYEDAVSEIAEYLKGRVDALESAGINRSGIIVDPGIGFGKLSEHNLELIRNIGKLTEVTGRPVLIGVSRKSMLGAITSKPVDKRLASSIAAAIFAAERGAAILRVHDVAETVDALKVWKALKN